MAKKTTLHLPSCAALRRAGSPRRKLTDADCSCGAVPKPRRTPIDSPCPDCGFLHKKKYPRPCPFARPKRDPLAGVKAAHDKLSAAIEDPEGGNDAEHDAAVMLCEELTAFYPPKKEIAVGPKRVAAYVADGGNACPLPRCGGSVDGTGETEMLDADEIAVGRKCLKCGATWDDFYHLADISTITPKGA